MRAVFRRRSKSTNRRGVAAAEFAVCLPVLVLLLLGMIEACSMVFLKQTLATAAYEGAHTGVVPNATSADVRAIAQQILTDRRVADAVVQVVPDDLQALPEGEFFEVRVSAPTDSNAVMIGRFFTGQTLTSTATFVKEI